MFDKAALRMAQEIDSARYAGTMVDPAKFNPANWRKPDLIDALRNKAQELLPPSPNRQDIKTIRNAARQACRKHGLTFTLELQRLATLGRRHTEARGVAK